MKRHIPVIILIALVLMTTTAFGQYREGAVQLTLDAGAAMMNSPYSGGTLNGSAAGFAIDKTLKDAKFSLGGSLTWIRAEETVVIEDDKSGDVTYSSVPFRMTGRWNFLNSRFAANIGLGFGIHTSTLQLFAGTVDERSTTTSALSIGLPITAAFFLDPDFYLNFVYSPTWMSSSLVEDNLAHAFMLGLGFQWGAEEN